MLHNIMKYAVSNKMTYLIYIVSCNPVNQQVGQYLEVDELLLLSGGNLMVYTQNGFSWSHKLVTYVPSCVNDVWNS